MDQAQCDQAVIERVRRVMKYALPDTECDVGVPWDLWEAYIGVLERSQFITVAPAGALKRHRLSAPFLHDSSERQSQAKVSAVTRHLYPVIA